MCSHSRHKILQAFLTFPPTHKTNPKHNTPSSQLFWCWPSPETSWKKREGPSHESKDHSILLVFEKRDGTLQHVKEYFAWTSHFLFFCPCASLISAFPFHISGNPMLKWHSSITQCLYPHLPFLDISCVPQTLPLPSLVPIVKSPFL